ncbi:hypothetical protein HS088_TW21G00741 [Tripterygium wilfordii]|uniref:Uncharacterized protein n=1 Tax=Tripterygium wilfordii TaxID=458696 RepID=A0A7J7C3A0_TRIWF|nr:uncharacterized protein LOC119989966 [Tripterygium wilfordii]KAF5728593.1 hypothetical protein HS088_TW21G00741 [Tripterygium wilfordii]
MLYKASTTTVKFSNKMAATAPIAIGTRGTVGSLVRKEIEYFTKFELQCSGSCKRRQGKVVDLGCSTGNSRPGFWYLTMSWKRKKRRINSGFLPSMCSVVEVADGNRTPGLSYRILENDLKNLHI